MDVQKQVDYWRDGSEEDLEAARSLLEKGHLRHALFFAHLAMEKMLKAHVTRRTNDMPPRIHSLIRLAEIAGLALDADRDGLLREFGIYQLAGRYPDSAQVPLDSVGTHRELLRVEEMLKWLKTQL